MWALAVESWGWRDWRRGRSLLKLPAGAVKERAQSEGRDDRNLGRESKSGQVAGIEDVGHMSMANKLTYHCQLGLWAPRHRDVTGSVHPTKPRQRAKMKVCLGPRKRA